MFGAAMPVAAERRDRHRRLALPVDLHEALAHGGDGIPDVGEIHRPAAIDDGAQPLAVLAAAFGGIDQPPHHGRSGKHHDIVELAAEIEYLVGIKTAGLRHDMPPAYACNRSIVESVPMRDGRG